MNEEVLTKISELGTRFEALQNTMQLYQNNINQNISWFYAVLAIIVATMGIALFFLVKNQVQAGIEKGVEEYKKEFNVLLESIGQTIDNKFAEYKEQGTWTPTFNNNQCKAKQYSRYYMFDNMVVLFMEFEATNRDLSLPGNIEIGGLPFVCSESINFACIIKEGGEFTPVAGYIPKNRASMFLTLPECRYNQSILIAGTIIHPIN